MWGVPGGKLEKNETPFKAVLREFLEETGISLNPKKLAFFQTVYIRDLKYDFIFHMFTYEFDKKPHVIINPKEHQAVIWETYEKTILLPLLRGEAECLRLLEEKTSL